ncbi:GMC family oxidoreductase N-terminal domain-containing protein [Microbacterium trichothecenolyticum]|uniref:GMC oxidoreductase n=1 Tax=Microbacterium trichothecenolyticum TaxID=69370 RepID=UPI001C6F1996|nr:GMC oxidoreductase [Microbacterium trichothecenolyticum]MBW9120059.1 GMC family oxidoreductase N-terminal domain-containing protein [Microbacterium trichothecenolyticum]
MTRYPDAVDVAIVGSGPTGAAYARILSEQAPGATIAMFEVGPTISDPPGAHVKNIADPEARARAQAASEGPGERGAKVANPGAAKAGVRAARPGTFLLEDGYQFPGEDGLPVVAMSSNVGGMSAHWTGACPRPGGSERIDFLPDFDELLAEGDRLLGVTTNAFDAAPFGEIVRERLAKAVDEGRTAQTKVQRMPLAAHRREDGRLVWSGSDVVLGDVTRENPDFSLFDESLVTAVLVHDGGAAGVRVRDLRSGETHEVGARFVVVAADALRTPQLLWASGIRPAALGRYLNDQAQVVFASRLRGVETLGADAPTTGLAEYSGVSWVPFTDDVPFHGQVMQLDASPIPLAEDDPVVPGSIVGLGLFCAKDLQADDRVEFDDAECDAYGMPAPRIHYTLTDRDHEVIERARAEIVRLGEAVGDPLDARPFTLPLGSSLHYQGTTRMGETDDGTSVCGPDSEVWGVPGLFVAGNGVIPTATACNPTVTSVALGVRGARKIARDLASV